MSNNKAADIRVNYGESVIDGQLYDGPTESRGFRTMAKDGYYKVLIEKCEPGESSTGNGTLNLEVQVLDKDEAGVRSFGTVVCTGFTKETPPRPNILNLFNLLLSAGRSKESVDAKATGKETETLGQIADSLTKEGQNIAYAHIRHKIADRGKMAGKEVTEARGFILRSTYEKRIAEKGQDGIRWDKSDEVKNPVKSNGATTPTMSQEQLDAAAINL